MAVKTFAVVEYSGGYQGDGEFIIQVEQTLFRIQLPYESGTRQSNFLDRLYEVESADDAEGELAEILGEKCQPVFQVYTRPVGQDLSSHVKRSEVILISVTRGAGFNVDFVCEHKRPPPRFQPVNAPVLLSYQLADALVTDTRMGGRIFNVVVAGKSLVCKMAREGSLKSFNREISLLQQLSTLSA